MRIHVSGFELKLFIVFMIVKKLDLFFDSILFNKICLKSIVIVLHCLQVADAN